MSEELAGVLGAVPSGVTLNVLCMCKRDRGSSLLVNAVGSRHKTTLIQNSMKS